MSQSLRGAAAGSGAFKSLGRSLAFASGGFIAAASITDVLSDSISEAQEAAVVQRKLAAQFRASGQNLQQYQQQIDETSTRLAFLAGFQDEELKSSFITAFRGTEDVSSGLKIQAIAADVARARNISLQTATIALTKAFLGQTTALKRLGVNVPATLHGMQALNFVQQKFAGQAKAGTTEQERFAVAIKETEEIIGTALLPQFNKLLSSMSTWLSKTENQQRVQRGAEKGAHALGTTVSILGKAVSLATSRWNPFVDVVQMTAAAVHGLNKEMERFNALKALKERGAPTGEDIGLRGAGSRQDTIAGIGATAGGGGGGRSRASLNFQISIVQEQLAKAELTASKKDDRAKLMILADLTRQKIAKTKELGARTQLLRTLGSIEEQIAMIDAQGAAAVKEARDKRQDAARKQAEKERQAHAEHLEKLQRIHEREAEATRRASEKVKDTFASVRASFSTALESARSGIGQLFTGPILNPSQDANKRLLGVPGPDANTLVKDLRAQTAQFARLQRDLTRLRKAGAPKGLIGELQGLGVSAIPQIEALLGDKGARQGFFKAFGQREKLAVNTARMEVNASRVVLFPKSEAPIEVTINMDGKAVAKAVAKHEHRHKTKNAARTRGRSGGLGPVIS